jgi:hypothetical protein
MIQIDNAQITDFIYHKVDAENQTIELNSIPFDIASEFQNELLKKIFIKPFTSIAETHEFMHAVDVDLNTLFNVANKINADEDFITQSHNICNYLGSVSNNSNIKSGELFIAKLNNVIIDNGGYRALAICKVETKDSFIETTNFEEGNGGLNFKLGIGNKKLDKACLIIFTRKPNTVLVIDNAATETDYWQNKFLNLKLKADYNNSTTQFLTLTKSFVVDQLDEEYEMSKADKINFLNRSVEYFKNNDTFEKENFEKEVFQSDDLISSFKKFDNKYQHDNNLQLEEDFQISALAVKKQARVFKSILKLDKNFHIYIHGDTSLIEQGIENDGRKYYKIYFETEA